MEVWVTSTGKNVTAEVWVTLTGKNVTARSLLSDQWGKVT